MTDKPRAHADRLSTAGLIGLISGLLALDVHALPPLNLSGAIKTGYFVNSSTRRLQGSQARRIGIDLRANSYIWQPWFARFDVALTLADNRTDRKTGTEFRGDSVSGAVNINALHTTRFPFTFSFQRDRHDTNEDLRGRIDATTSSVRLNQQYRDASGSLNANLQYFNGDRRITDGNQRIRTEQASFSFSKTYKNHNVSLQVQSEDRDNRTIQARSDIDNSNLLLRHTYRNNAQLSFESLLTHVRDHDVYQDVDSSFSDTVVQDLTQFSTFMNWRPRRDDSMILAVNGRYVINDYRNFAGSQGNGVSEVRNGSIGTNFYYRFSEDISFATSLNYSRRNQGGVTSELHNEQVRFNYSPRRLRLNLGRFKYSWFIGGNVSNRASAEIVQQSFSLAGDQSLTRDAEFGPFNINISLSQQTSLLYMRNGEDAKLLSHSAAISWVDPTSAGSNSVALVMNDHRTFSKNPSATQLVNLEFAQIRRLSRSTSWGANFTIQATRQKNVRRDILPPTEKQVTVYIDGSAYLTRQNVFGVERLDFNSIINYSTDALTPDAYEVRRGTSSLEESRLRLNLRYRIGKIRMQFEGQLFNTEDNLSKSARFELTRSL